MKKKMTTVFFVLLFLAGLSLLLYPFLANEWNTYRQSQLITTYETSVGQLDDVRKIDYDAEWERAEAYNEALLPSILPDSFAIAEAAEEPDEEYMACLNLVGDGMMGYVEIPKIGIKIPIYHTVDDEVLQTAAGHLEGSSLPSGNKDAHAVISAHRGLPSAELFTDLDRLEEGDHFLLHILDKILCYEVDKISVVEPENTDALIVEDGKDLVTLLTCTPYGVNSHRLLVRGHRTTYQPDILEAEAEVPFVDTSMHTNYLFWVVAGLVITGLFILGLYLRERKLRKKAAETKIEEQPKE